MKNVYFAILLMFTINAVSAQNCYPTFSDPDDDIYYFSFNDIINNASQVSTNGVSVYPDSLFTTQLTLGLSYNLKVLPEHSSGINRKYGIWIDYNNDGNFSSNENIYSSQSIFNNVNISVTIPNDTSIIGKRKIRIISIKSYSTLDVCGVYSDGECEEYTIEFVSDTILPAYCIPVNASSSSSGAEIESFSVNTLHNCLSQQSYPSYTHYSDSVHTTTLEMGKSYNMFISKGGFAGISIGVRAFLDYNNDRIFSSNEIILTTTDAISNKLITIPFDSSFVGKRRLRVFSTAWNYPSSACASYSIGEVEDYDITIAFPTPDTNVQSLNRVERKFLKTGYQVATKLIEAYDKGILISGKENDDIYTIKTTIDGFILKERKYLSDNGYNAAGMDKTFDGGHIISGGVNTPFNMYNGFIRKNDACGNIEWEKYFGDSTGYSYLREVYQTQDSGYMASGSYLFPNHSNDSGRVCLLKTDKLGNLLWLKDYTYHYGSDVRSFITTQDNGALLLVGGRTPNIYGSNGYLNERGILTKVDSLGNLQWNLVLNNNDIISSVLSSVELSDNGFITAGYVRSFQSNEYNLAFFKTSKNGNLIKQNIIENTDFYLQKPKVIRRINDNKFMVLCNDVSECDLGGYFPHVSVLIIDSNLNIINYKQINSTNIRAEDAIITSNNKIMLLGSTIIDRDIYMAKLNVDDLSFDTVYNTYILYDSICASISINQSIVNNKYNVRFSPNPTSNNVRVEVENYINQSYYIEMYNTNGQLIETLNNINEESLIINLDKFPKGLILIRIIFDDGAINTKKIIKI